MNDRKEYGRKSQEDLVADMLTDSSSEIVVGPDGTIMPKNKAIRDNVDGTKLLKQRVWGGEDFVERAIRSNGRGATKKADPDELVSEMLADASSEIVVGPDGTIMQKNEALRENVDGTRLLKQRVWGAGSPAEEYIKNLMFECFDLKREEEPQGTFGAAVENDDDNEIRRAAAYDLEAEGPLEAAAPETAGGGADEEAPQRAGKAILFKEILAEDIKHAEYDDFGTARAGFHYDAESLVHYHNAFKWLEDEYLGVIIKLEKGETENIEKALESRRKLICNYASDQTADYRVAIVTDAEVSFAAVYEIDGGEGLEGVTLRAIDTELVTVSEDIFSRNAAILETRELAGKKVVIIGAGSMGSVIACELAKAGVGNFAIADMDRLSAANVCRHACGVRDLGRYKAFAVRDLVRNINPLAGVETSTGDVTADMAAAEKLCENADLLITTTDTMASRRLVNYISIKKGVPALFSGVFERASGGRIFKVEPAAGTACLECHQIETFEEKPGFVTYSAAKDPRDLTIQPGLSVDIGMTTMLTVKMAIAALREDKRGAMPYGLVIVRQYSPEGGVAEPLKFMFARPENIQKNPECPVCGNQGVAAPDGAAM